MAEDEDHGLVESAAPDLFRGEQQGALRKRLAVFLFFGRGEGAKAVCRGFVNDGGVSRFFVAHSCLSLVPKMLKAEDLVRGCAGGRGQSALHALREALRALKAFQWDGYSQEAMLYDRTIAQFTRNLRSRKRCSGISHLRYRYVCISAGGNDQHFLRKLERVRLTASTVPMSCAQQPSAQGSLPLSSP